MLVVTVRCIIEKPKKIMRIEKTILIYFIYIVK